MAERTPLLRPSTPPLPAPVHYLQTHRAVVFQFTSLLTAIDGLAGTYALKLLNSNVLLARSYGATLDIGNAWFAGFLLTVAGALAGAACGILFLVLMLHPSHGETRNRVLAKEGVFAVFATFFLVSSVFSTVVVATGSATLYTPKLSEEMRRYVIEKLGGSLAYRNFGPAITFVVLGWISWASFTLSLVLVSLAGRHVLHRGPALGVVRGLPERLAAKHLAPYLGINPLVVGGEPHEEQ